MKVVFVIKTLHAVKGGAERVLAIIANGLAKKNGYDVQIITFDREGVAPVYPIENNIEITCLGIGDVGKRSNARDMLVRMGHLRKVIKRESPNLVIPFLSSSFFPVSVALMFTGIPILASEHSVFYGSKSWRILPLFVMSIFLVKKITCLSESVRMTFPWIIRRKMHPLPNPVMQSNDPLLEKKDARRIFLSMGRLEPAKDFEILMEAFATIAEELKSWVLYIYGEGSMRVRLEEMIKAKKLEERIFLPGSVDDIQEIYRKADVFVSSSRYESFGLAAAEAMACQIPCVGFRDCPGINEIVVHGENGLLAEGLEDPKSLAMRMKELAQNESKRADLGKNARISMEKFATPKIVEKWEELIGDVV